MSLKVRWPSRDSDGKNTPPKLTPPKHSGAKQYHIDSRDKPRLIPPGNYSKLKYPTWEKKKYLKSYIGWDMLVPWRIPFLNIYLFLNSAISGVPLRGNNRTRIPMILLYQRYIYIEHIHHIKCLYSIPSIFEE